MQRKSIQQQNYKFASDRFMGWDSVQSWKKSTNQTWKQPSIIKVNFLISFSQDYKITTSVTDLEMYQNLGWRVCIPISSLNFPMFSEAVSKAGKSVCSPFQTPQKILKHVSGSSCLIHFVKNAAINQLYFIFILSWKYRISTTEQWTTLNSASSYLVK